MNKERLLRLADVILPKVSKENFDMSYWECGTTACAIGWACQDPVFKVEGFKLKKVRYDDTWKVPFYEGVEGRLTRWFAIQRFFEIGLLDAQYLFNGIKYHGETGLRCKDVPPEAISKRIHALIKREERKEEMLSALRYSE